MKQARKLQYEGRHLHAQRTAAWRWILRAIAIALIAAIVTWFLPDGLAVLFDEAQGGEQLQKFFSASSGFLVALCIQLILWVRIQQEASEESFQGRFQEATASLRKDLLDSVDRAIKSSTAAILLPDLQHSPEVARLLEQISDLIHSFAVHNDVVKPAITPFIERRLAQCCHDVDDIRAKGIKLDVAEHVEMTRRLCESATEYLQINRKAYDVNKDWSLQWKNFLTWISVKDISATYIVLCPEAEKQTRKDDLASMRTHFESLNIVFGVCSLEKVEDALGGNLPTKDVVEIFDKFVAKLSPPPNQYSQKGEKIRNQIRPLIRGDDIQHMVRVVQDIAVVQKRSMNGRPS